MRAIDGPCGHHLEAENDEALFNLIRAHADEVHPEFGLTDAQISRMVRESAYDVVA